MRHACSARPRARHLTAIITMIFGAGAMLIGGCATLSTGPGPSPWVTPADTGVPAGTTLTAYTGLSTITTPGTVIDGKNITTCLDIEADNVTIRDSRVSCDGIAILHKSGKHVLVDHVEVTGAFVGRAIESWASGLTWGQGLTVDHAYIHGTMRGVNLADGTTVMNSYIADNVAPPDDGHTSMMRGEGALHDVVVTNNVIEISDNTNETAAIEFSPENWHGGANVDALFAHNLLAGGAYCAYLGNGADEQPNQGLVFVDNVFSRAEHQACGWYGPLEGWSGSYPGEGVANEYGNVWSGNVWDDGGLVTP